MSFFDKLSKFFRRSPAPTPGGDPATDPAAPAAKRASNGASRAAHGPAADDHKGNGHASIRDQFLEELRSIPTRPSDLDSARDQLLNELKRLSGGDKGGRPS